jgi:hypothetical protein
MALLVSERTAVDRESMQNCQHHVLALAEFQVGTRRGTDIGEVRKVGKERGALVTTRCSFLRLLRRLVKP